MKKAIQDQYGRTFRTLRVSLTNVCNLGCIYCVHSKGEQLPSPTGTILNYKEIATLVKKIHRQTTLETIRLTGGEPTLYKDLLPFIKEINAIGIEHIKMTSNGYLLEPMVKELSNAGLKKINISLDAVEAKSFNKISGRKQLDRILNAIDKALEHGIEVKINTVILKGINEDQLIPLLKFSMDRNITIRFLELMRMGPLFNAEQFDTYFLSEAEILKRIGAVYPFLPLVRKNSSTANYWKTSEGHPFGIIANESSPFCQDCNRLRLDSYGNIYGCLSNEAFISIKDSLDNEMILKEKLMSALSHKQEFKFTGSAISMMAIGG